MHSLNKYGSIKSDVRFLLSAAFIFMYLQTTLRAILLWRNDELSAHIPISEIINSFLVGVKFDLIMTVYACAPLIMGMLYVGGLKHRRLYVLWLTVIGGLYAFLAVLELDFYHEFHVRLNSLVFQYIKEDASTVMSMIWNGFPVLRYLLLFAFITMCLFWLLSKSSKLFVHRHSQRGNYIPRIAVFLLIFVVSVVSARGTVRTGPPLRSGDAFHSNHLFANHLAYNGSHAFAKAFMYELNKKQEHSVQNWMPMEESIKLTANMLASKDDILFSPGKSPVLRKNINHNGLASTSPLNVVLILMESFSGEFVGSLGHDFGITPEFDRLRIQGLLFERFFSNGTHTHQGMFATVACFPNLPGYEYLMQQPEGDTQFSGVIKMTSDRDYQSLYVYNGDMSWDNQNGFFGAQGMERFIGRNDYINPKHKDRTWGVSDEDMFNRAAQELASMPKDKPFFALLQSLSNHTPYNLPSPLSVERVTGHGELNERLTAMRYSDWALGQFFKQAQQSDYYENTVFVVLGDHGFNTDQQLTDIDLLRFHVPLLIVAPGLQAKYGTSSLKVGSQVDVAPTIAGLLGGETVHSCWGRDLFDIDDNGFAVIKPSGQESLTAIIQNDMILVEQPDAKPKLYTYNLGAKPFSKEITNDVLASNMSTNLHAYIQTATTNLVHANVGDTVNE